jgi:hypothetical protein
MIALVLFTTRAPFTLADDLIQAGFRVFEAMAISEVLHLCATEKIDIVVITADIAEYRTHEIQSHHTTLRLKTEATIKELIDELWQMFPEKAGRVQ